MTRSVEDRRGLVRLVRAPDGRVFCDYRGRLKGRGAWVTPTTDALERLQKSPGILFRPLNGRCDTTGLLEQVRLANAKAVEDLLSIAARAGLLQGGKDGVRGAISSGKARGVLLASDASPRLVEDLRRRAGELPVAQLPMDREALGQRIGKGPRAALAVLAGKPASALLLELRRYEGLR
ncbi:MAG: DUF448 domain-containing protein [Myxococcota bacterium]|nr:DUF448 domain-containing protein [Myxococcota bacterium]